MVRILQRESCAKDHQRCLHVAQRGGQWREKAAAELGLDLVLAVEDGILVVSAVDQSGWRDELPARMSFAAA